MTVSELKIGGVYWRRTQDSFGIRREAVILQGLTQGDKAIVDVQRDSHIHMEICPVEEIGKPVMENEDV